MKIRFIVVFLVLFTTVITALTNDTPDTNKTIIVNAVRTLEPIVVTVFYLSWFGKMPLLLPILLNWIRMR